MELYIRVDQRRKAKLRQILGDCWRPYFRQFCQFVVERQTVLVPLETLPPLEPPARARHELLEVRIDERLMTQLRRLAGSGESDDDIVSRVVDTLSPELVPEDPGMIRVRDGRVPLFPVNRWQRSCRKSVRKLSLPPDVEALLVKNHGAESISGYVSRLVREAAAAGGAKQIAPLVHDSRELVSVQVSMMLTPEERIRLNRQPGGRRKATESAVRALLSERKWADLGDWV